MTDNAYPVNRTSNELHLIVVLWLGLNISKRHGQPFLLFDCSGGRRGSHILLEFPMPFDVHGKTLSRKS